MFVLYRIIGNDLPPRHEVGCALDCTKLIAENEELPSTVHRRWLVNRIYNEELLEKTLIYLEDNHFPYDVVAFSPQYYASLKKREEKIAYLTNVNHARNSAIRVGRNYGDIVLPLDSRSVFSKVGWEVFENTVTLNPNALIYLLGQWRLPSRDLSSQGPLQTTPPQLTETYHHLSGSKRTAYREPAVAVTKDSPALFDESIMYGDGDKCRMLMKYGVNGIWDHWFPAQDLVTVPEGKKPFVHAGWVGILPTKNRQADENNITRGKYRAEGLAEMVVRADKEVKMLGYTLDG